MGPSVSSDGAGLRYLGVRPGDTAARDCAEGNPGLLAPSSDSSIAGPSPGCSSFPTISSGSRPKLTASITRPWSATTTRNGGSGTDRGRHCTIRVGRRQSTNREISRHKTAMPRLSRRELLAGLLGTSAGLSAGCEGRAAIAATGRGNSRAELCRRPSNPRRLSAPAGKRPLARDGYRHHRWRHVGTRRRLGLEVQRPRALSDLGVGSVLGGTSRSGQSPLTAYPWGAHYVPVPLPENRSLIALLREMGVIERVDAAGVPVVAEQYLCRDPGERVCVDGTWYEGLYPSAGATPRDLDELRDFRAEIARWVQWRDGKGRRAFAIPVPHGSDDPEVTALDGLSMGEWVRRHSWTSPRLLWLIDYSCRDDYGRDERTNERLGRTVLFRVAGPRAGERIAAAHHLAGGQRPNRALFRRPLSQPAALRDGCGRRGPGQDS